MVFRFAGFELDEQRAELCGPDGATIKLRPKTFEMLRLLAANAGRVLTKRELMEAVWPNVHVGEDGLFQCIREIRTALGDERREMVKLVSGRGYLLAVEVSSEPAGVAAQLEPLDSEVSAARGRQGWLSVGQRASAAFAVAGFAVVITLAAVASTVGPDLVPKVTPPTIAILPIVDASQDGQGAAMAVGVTNSLIDGLAQISSFRVVSPPTDVATARSTPDLLVRGELVRAPDSWTLQLRTIKGTTGEVQSVTTASVGSDEPDVRLLQARLAAGAGDPLARRLNMLFEAGEATGTGGVDGSTAPRSPSSRPRPQSTRPRASASAWRSRCSRRRSPPSQATLTCRWRSRRCSCAASRWSGTGRRKRPCRSRCLLLLKRALETHPNYISVLEAYCRFLSTTNHFAESLVACGRALSFDPWDGSALYLTGLGQVFLGRFEDALASFKLADRYDTPVVGRWTWKLGIGWTYVLTGHNEEALPWLEQSIAITPASGRSYLQLAIAYQRLGRTEDAKVAFAKAMELRPGSTALNVMPPTENVSPRFLELAEKSIREMIELGLPES